MPLDSDLSASSIVVHSPEVNAQQPWLGLLPYREEHREFFFGRDRELEDILGRIRDNSLTILYGQSGLGKSSLLAAGVMPQLREAGYAPRWARLSFEEGKRFQTLVQQTHVLISAAQGTLTAGDFEGEGPLQRLTFWERFHHRDAPTSPVPVLIFDQFEEIFTLGAQARFTDEVADWLEQMADLLQNRPPRHLAERFAQDSTLAEQYHFGDAPVRIVFTLREDYLAQLERWKARLPLLMQNRMALTLLTGPQARQAVLGPAQYGYDSLVSREVAESIVRTVARVPRDTPLDQIKAVPPLLSLLCEQLNAARLSAGSAQITAESVRDQADDILQRFYVESFLSFPEEHRARIRALLEDPPMITEGGFRNALVREDAEAQLTRAGVADAKAIFDTLIQRRLITAETRDQVQRLEITHDVLVPLLLRSRKERHDREAKEQAEQDAKQARLAKERRQLRVITVIMVLLSLTAICFAAYGLSEANDAREAKNRAEEARLVATESAASAQKARRSAIDASQKAEQAQQEALIAAAKEKEANEKNLRTLHEASMADYATAVQRIEADGKWDQGVAHIIRSLKWEPGNQLAAIRLYTTLSFYAAEKQSWPREILHHDDNVLNAQYSPDGSRIVTVSEDNTARVWGAASGKPLGEPMRHKDSVWSAQFSPDGNRIVTASLDHTAQVWDATSGKPLGAPMIHGDRVWSARFSPDGNRIVTASSDHTAQVWDAPSGKPLGEPMRHGDRVSCAVFSPDGSRIATASDDSSMRIWDVASGSPLGEPILHEASVSSVQFSPDGSFIVTASDDNSARIWDAASGKAVSEPMLHNGVVNSAQFCPDGRRIVTVSNNTARIWDAPSGKPLSEALRHEKGVNSAQFNPDGTQIVTTSKDYTARIWDAASGKSLGEPLRHEDQVTRAQFSPDGSRILTIGSIDQASIWDATSGKRLGKPLRQENRVNNAQFSTDGNRIVTATRGIVAIEDEAQVWEASSGQRLGTPMRHENSVNSAEFSLDGNRVVTASNDNTAKVWDATSGKQLSGPMHHKDNVLSAKFSPDGKLIVTGSDDNTARIWDAATGKQLGAPMNHKDTVIDAKFSPDGTRIVTTIGRLFSLTTEIRVWNTADGTPLSEPMRHENRVTSAQFSIDGTRIVTASDDSTARIWEAASGKPLCESMRHEDSTNSAEFNPDCSLIVTASDDKTARVWDVTVGTSLGEPLRHEESVNSAQFSPNGTRIVTASNDKTARVWNVGLLMNSLPAIPEWIFQFGHTIAGIEFDASGQMKIIPGEKRLEILRTPIRGNDPWTMLARWIIQPATERTLTPNSKFTCRQIAERERDSGTREGLESALRYDPTVPLAHLMLAMFERNPNRAKFLRSYDLKRLPDDANLWSRASESLLKQKQVALALEAARKAVKLDKNLISAQRELAYALNAGGLLFEAIKSWDQVLGSNVVTFEDFCDAGYLAAKLGQGDKARSIFNEGMVRYPNIPRLIRFKGKALLLLNAPAEALATLEAYEPNAIANHVSDLQHDAIAALSVSRWLTGDKTGAVKDYQRLIDMASGYANVEAVTKSYWEDAIKQPMLEVLAETLRRHPELRPNKAKDGK